MSLRVEPFAESKAREWDRFCEGALNATLLHTRRFLSYHEGRFQDRSLIFLDGDAIVGVLPAAEHPADAHMVVSHPGSTYGGLVHDGQLIGERALEAMSTAAGFYRNLGYTQFQYKALPHIYASVPSQDDLYALFRMGAIRARCDLSSTICLAERRPCSDRRRRALKKAQRLVSVAWDTLGWPSAWQLIADNLARKHGASPVHSAEELALLHLRFPESIRVVSATHNTIPVAAVVLFNSRHVWHAQYIASSEVGYDTHALDAIFDAIIARATESRARYFDFGTSNEDAGKTLNSGLYRFKSEFGGGGVAHEFYQLNLQ